MTFDSSKIIPVRLGTSHCYFLPSSQGAVLIDAGPQHKQQHLQSVLLAHEHDIREIHYIILTHTHSDHVGSLAEIKRISGAKVFVHKDEAAFLAKGQTPLPRGTSLWTNTVVQIGKIIRFGNYPAVSADFIITNELQLSEFDFELDILSTPGHTAGSMSIILDKKYAFVGDAMFHVRPDTVFPPFLTDAPALLSSWNRLLEADCDLYFPSHGRPIPWAKLEQSYQKALKHAKK